jgi:hypothetical protein
MPSEKSLAGSASSTKMELSNPLKGIS